MDSDCETDRRFDMYDSVDRSGTSPDSVFNGLPPPDLQASHPGLHASHPGLQVLSQATQQAAEELAIEQAVQEQERHLLELKSKLQSLKSSRSSHSSDSSDTHVQDDTFAKSTGEVMSNISRVQDNHNSTGQTFTNGTHVESDSCKKSVSSTGQMFTNGSHVESVSCKRSVSEVYNSNMQMQNESVNSNAGSVVTSSQPIDNASVVQALLQSFHLQRLPTPEPMVFTGDMLEYLGWKKNFHLLFENKGLTSADKMFYLKQYLGGKAKKAVEGFFYSSTDDSYANAWKVLERRYNHPFLLLEAYRHKLENWPEIKSNNGESLQTFADFLNVCVDAMAHVPGLSILNDCKENQQMVKRLPEFLVQRWRRKVDSSLNEKGRYPAFAEFADFIGTEARILCNPVFGNYFEPKSMRQSRESEAYKTKSLRANVFATTTGQDVKQERACLFCKEPSHSIYKCVDFQKLSLTERKKSVFEQRLCYGCLQKNHMSKNCKRRHTCAVCNKKHPTLLHENKEVMSNGFKVRSDKHFKPESESGNNSIPAAVSFKVSHKTDCNTSMIVPVWVSTSDNQFKEVLTYAMLDNQSDATFILEDLAKSIGCKATEVKLKLTTMVSQSSLVDSSAVQNLNVRGMHSSTRIKIPLSYTREFIPGDATQIPTNDTAVNWPHLMCIADDLPALQDCKIGLLIGNNCPQGLIPRETKAGKDDEPYAVKTDLGWSIVGGDSSDQSKGFVCNRIQVKESPQVAPVTLTPSPSDVVALLQADFQDTQHGDKTVSQEDLKFIQIMEDSIHQGKDGHYIMPLPFKSEMPVMPNNKQVAAVRLGYLKKKFESNPKYFSDYKKFMQEIIDRGDVEVARELPKEGHTWYIPHHGVYHPRKPEKIRVVFDCSAKYRSSSLNNNLLTGPDLINSLSGVLCRFREHPVAFMCDIKKMFHQFFVEERHQDYLRFLWWEESDIKKEIKEFRVKVHLFGAASSPGCANFALKYHAKQAESEYPQASKFIQENFYVDDGLYSCESEEEALQLIQSTREVCKRAGLHLHKFLANNETVMSGIESSDRATKEVKNVQLGEDVATTERALGVQWQVDSDTFTFSVSDKEYEATRRGTLSAVATIYDPLGFIAPFVLEGKVILREMCRSGTSWDDPIPDWLVPRWEKWRADCSNLPTVNIPRCFRPKNITSVERYELHHFSDGSMSGYGQCSYLRVVGRESVHVTLVAAKARVAPSKITTIPRLELTAACVSALMSYTLKEELKVPIEAEYFWTDSKIVLSYISNEAKRFHVFVANRISKIHQLTDVQQWHYIETSENPADHASRGRTVQELINSNWFKGPAFLWNINWRIEDEKDWKSNLNVGDPEVRKVATLRTSASSESEFNIVDRLESFSAWSSAVSAVTCLKRAARGVKNGEKMPSCEERLEAERFIIKSLQRKAFSEEIQALSDQLTVKGTSPLYKLDPYFDQNGIIRVGGRLSKGDISEDIKHPILLPKGSHVTTLLIKHFHAKVKHQGRGITLNEIRSSGYWVIGGNRAVRDLIQKCVICRKLRRPVEEQRMADLPAERVEASPPFTYCGIDVFGPFNIKKGRKEIKRYGLLFTCLCCRGVHIEMLDDLSTDSMINALRCFIAIRGAVRQIRCDHGTNFIGAHNEFIAAMKKDEQVERFLAGNQCSFIFNTTSASHAAGVWERQIKTARSVLNATLLMSQGRMDDASLRTFMYEAMAIINSRPLAVDNLNDPNSMEPLTPNHIITMKSSVPLPPPGKFVKEDIYIAKRWRRVQYLTEIFWGRWKKEYLLSLNQRDKWNLPRRNMKVGDVVMLKEDTPRMQWPLAIVTQIFPSTDGLVRKVEVKRGSSLLERPVQKLVLLVEADAVN